VTKAQKLKVQFIEKRKLNDDTFEFHFSKPVGFKFTPGQYLKMFLSIKNPDRRGSSRYFTISASPKDSYLTITTKIIKSSFKKKLVNLKKGDEISIFGPIGYFYINNQNLKPKIMLAGGMGITPYHSILKALNIKKLKFQILLLSSFSKFPEVFYKKEFEEINRGKIKVIFTLTKDQKDGFEKGRINREMIEKYYPNWRKAEFFVTGSEKTEKGLLKLLKEMGVKEKNIFSENFPGY